MVHTIPIVVFLTLLSPPQFVPISIVRTWNEDILQIDCSSLNLEFEDILHFDTSHETDTMSLETMLSSISNKR